MARYIIIPLLFIHLNLYAADYYWDLVNALSKDDNQKVEQIIKENASKMSPHEKRQIYTFVLDYARKDSALNTLELLAQYNLFPIQYDLFHAIRSGHRDNAIDFILANDIAPNGEILLMAAEKNRLNFVQWFVANGVDVNYRYPDGKSYSDGMTALLWAAKWCDFNTVRQLVERGADINARAKNGYTALAYATEAGESGIANYLRARGAAETGPGGNYPLQQNGAFPNAGMMGIGSIIENDFSQFRPGTYRLVGGNTEMKFSGNGNGQTRSGTLSYRSNAGNMGVGSFQLDGSAITINTGTFTFVYRVDSNTSFSGNGEMWVRTGD